MNPPPARAFERGGWRLVAADGGLPEELRRALIEKSLAAARGELGPPRRRSRHATTWQLRLGGPMPLEFFIKIIDSAGPLGRIKRLVRGGRAAHVARIVGALTDAGFAAPPILLRGEDRATGRELMVAPRAAGDGPLRALVRLGANPAGRARKRAVLRALGAEVARLHRYGFVHGDLTPFNIFIVPAEPPRFVFIDHERTRRAFWLGRRRRMLRNLVQLGRFAMPGVTATDRMRVLCGYAAGSGRAARRATIRRTAAMLGRRIRRDGLARIAPLHGGANKHEPIQGDGNGNA